MTTTTTQVITSDATGAIIPAKTTGRITIPNFTVGSTSFTYLDFASWAELITWAQAQQAALVGAGQAPPGM